jgi:hypothetical protein
MFWERRYVQHVARDALAIDGVGEGLPHALVVERRRGDHHGVEVERQVGPGAVVGEALDVGHELRRHVAARIPIRHPGAVHVQHRRWVVDAVADDAAQAHLRRVPIAGEAGEHQPVVLPVAHELEGAIGDDVFGTSPAVTVRLHGGAMDGKERRVGEQLQEVRRRRFEHDL